MKLYHHVLIRYGDLPARTEPCSLRGCQVDGRGITTCEHLACPVCGVGPPVQMLGRFLPIEDITDTSAYCEQCGYHWET